MNKKKVADLCFVCPKDHQCKYEIKSITDFFKHVKGLEKKLNKQLIYLIGERKGIFIYFNLISYVILI